jgi:O-Antigen ligase
VHSVGVDGRIGPRYEVIPTSFGVFTLVLLGGYALFGRGFAYLGVPPIFVGEFGLFLAILTILFSGVPQGLLRSPVTWLIILFMFWGAVCTFPYVDQYGLDALRDGALWGYALYALAVATVMLKLAAVGKVTRFYSRGLVIFLLLAPVLESFALFNPSDFPRWPWGPEGGVPVFGLKMGDFAVHYAGIFAFIALDVSAMSFRLPWMIAWFLGMLGPASVSRGGLLSVLSVVLLCVIVRPSIKFFYCLSFIGVFLMVLQLLGVVMNFEIPSDVQDRVRNLSGEQIILNVESILLPAEESGSELGATKRWRELWWDKIIHYTVDGDEFWTGKGFGINLADADGFQTQIDHSLRNPHSVHMTVLARSGVPGLVLWIVLQLAFVSKLFFNIMRDMRTNRSWLARVQIWTVLYWLAFIINGSFDVFLEGPQGGIWFWSIFGFGLALIVGRRDLLRSSATYHAVSNGGASRTEPQRKKIRWVQPGSVPRARRLPG